MVEARRRGTAATHAFKGNRPKATALTVRPPRQKRKPAVSADGPGVKKPRKAPAQKKAPEQKSPLKTDKTENFVYVLGSRRRDENGLDDCRTYVGWTNDIEKRLAQHNAGTGAKSTRGRSWFLIYVESCETRNAAMSREWHIKHDRKFRTQLLAALRAEN